MRDDTNGPMTYNTDVPGRVEPKQPAAKKPVAKKPAAKAKGKDKK